MLENLSLGALLIACTVLVHTFGLIYLSRWLMKATALLRLHKHHAGKTAAMVATVLGIFAIHTVEIWMWAAAFIATGAIQSFGDALYFSTVAFSTVGSGTVAPVLEWRLFASLEGINGFILIGWSIAYLVAASTRFGPFRSGEHF